MKNTKVGGNVNNIVNWAVKNPDKTVGDIMKEFNVSQEVAWAVINQSYKLL